MNEFDRKVIDCVASLFSAINKCGGGSAEEALNMNVKDFCSMYGRNNIKFIYSKSDNTQEKEFNGTFSEALLLLPPVLRNRFLEMSSKNIVLSERVEELEEELKPYVSSISMSGLGGRFKGIREAEVSVEEPKDNGNFCTSYSFSPGKMSYTV